MMNLFWKETYQYLEQPDNPTEWVCSFNLPILLSLHSLGWWKNWNLLEHFFLDFLSVFELLIMLYHLLFLILGGLEFNTLDEPISETVRNIIIQDKTI